MIPAYVWILFAVVIMLVAVIAWFLGGLRANNQRKDSDKQVALLEARANSDESEKKNLLERIDRADTEIKEYSQFKALATERETLLAREQARTSDLQQRLTQAREKVASLDKQLETQQQELQKYSEKMENQFKVLAQKLFEESTARLSTENKEKLKTILDPLTSGIKEFRERVDHTFEEETKQRTTIQEQIKTLAEQNTRISHDAENLTNALRGQSKTQGAWGEVVLQRVLEGSGLREGEEYELQVSMTSDDNKRYRPDAIVHLPGKKDVIVDSKVSLVAYDDFIKADTEESRAEAQKALTTSVRMHMNNLSQKAYEKLPGVKSLDFVLMFLPQEGVLSVVLDYDRQIWEDAFRAGLMLVTPTTLIIGLRVIENSWRFERQNQNVASIFTAAGRLYDKFVRFVKDLEGVGKHLDAAHSAWDGAMNKLSTGKGNLIRSVGNLRSMGVKGSKSLEVEYAEVEEDDPPAIEDEGRSTS